MSIAASALGAVVGIVGHSLTLSSVFPGRETTQNPGKVYFIYNEVTAPQRHKGCCSGCCVLVPTPSPRASVLPAVSVGAG